MLYEVITIALDKDDYQYAMIAGPNRNYLWILARSPDLDENVVSSLVDKARDLKFPIDELIYVNHGARDDSVREPARNNFV